MFYSILLITAIAAMLYAKKRWLSLPPKQRKGFTLKALIWGGAAIVLILVLAGRAHWLMGVLAALIALAGRAIQLAQYAPAFKKLFGEFQQHTETPHGEPRSPEPRMQTMSRKEAADILGVSEEASPEQIKTAHKHLMQKVHPDRGGTDALATQLNRAKDILLNG